MTVQLGHFCNYLLTAWVAVTGYFFLLHIIMDTLPQQHIYFCTVMIGINTNRVKLCDQFNFLLVSDG